MQGLLLLHTSYDVMESNALIGYQFRVYNASSITSAQNDLWMFWTWSIFFAISIMVRFASLITLFSWGLYGVDICFSMLGSFKNHLNVLETNSPMLSDRNTLILYSDWFSISALNSLNLFKTSSFGLQYIQLHLLQKIINEGHEIPNTTHKCGPHRHVHVGMYKSWSFASSLCSKMQPYILHFLDLQVNYILHWWFHSRNEIPINCLFTKWKCIYWILDLECEVHSVWDL